KRRLAAPRIASEKVVECLPVLVSEEPEVRFAVELLRQGIGEFAPTFGAQFPELLKPLRAHRYQVRNHRHPHCPSPRITSLLFFDTGRKGLLNNSRRRSHCRFISAFSARNPLRVAAGLSPACCHTARDTITSATFQAALWASLAAQ